MTGGGDQVLVAPREVHDLVFRCARVAGMGAGAADRAGRNVTRAEVHFGGGLAAFASALGDHRRLVAEYDAGPEALMAGEVAARTGGSGAVAFTVPTPLAALASGLADMAGRGVGVEGIPVGASAATTIDHLQVGGRAEPAGGDAAARAAREGLAVDRASFEVLVDAARAFLVAESILDGIED